MLHSRASLLFLLALSIAPTTVVVSAIKVIAPVKSHSNLRGNRDGSTNAVNAVESSGGSIHGGFKLRGSVDTQTNNSLASQVDEDENDLHFEQVNTEQQNSQERQERNLESPEPVDNLLPIKMGLLVEQDYFSNPKAYLGPETIIENEPISNTKSPKPIISEISKQIEVQSIDDPSSKDDQKPKQHITIREQNRRERQKRRHQKAKRQDRSLESDHNKNLEAGKQTEVLPIKNPAPTSNQKANQQIKLRDQNRRQRQKKRRKNAKKTNSLPKSNHSEDESTSKGVVKPNHHIQLRGQNRHERQKRRRHANMHKSKKQGPQKTLDDFENAICMNGFGTSGHSLHLQYPDLNSKEPEQKRIPGVGCPGDVELLKQRGARASILPDPILDAVEIVRQETSNVTVDLYQVWKNVGGQPLGSFYYHYFKPGKHFWGNAQCSKETSVMYSPNEKLDTIEIACNVNSPYALLEICLVDDTSYGSLLPTFAQGSPTIPKTCKHEASPTDVVVCYNLEISCEPHSDDHTCS